MQRHRNRISVFASFHSCLVSIKHLPFYGKWKGMTLHRNDLFASFSSQVKSPNVKHCSSSPAIEVHSVVTYMFRFKGGTFIVHVNSIAVQCDWFVGWFIDWLQDLETSSAWPKRPPWRWPTNLLSEILNLPKEEGGGLLCCDHLLSQILNLSRSDGLEGGLDS